MLWGLTGERSFTYTRAMSKKQLISTLRVEISWLNRLIDHKILRGEPYRHLAKRHKQLVLKLAQA